MKLYIVKRFNKYTAKVVVQNKEKQTLYEGRVFNIPMRFLNKDILDIEPMLDENNKEVIKIIIKED